MSSSSVSNNLKFVFGVAILVFVIWIVPFIYIWSINTLFNTEIDYTLETWAASLILSNLISYNTHKK